MIDKPPVRQAAILVGGLGSRLGPLTATLPKPLVDVGGHPFLDHLLFELGRQGFTDIVLLAGFAADALEAYAAQTGMRERFALTIRVVREDRPAGTGGAVARARSLLEPRFLLLNGDSWLDANLRALATIEPPTGGAVMAVRQLADRTRSGAVTVDGTRVTRFAPRPESPGPGLVNAGIYLVDRTAFDGHPHTCSLEADVLPALADAGRLESWRSDGFFIDIGVPEALAAAQHSIPKQLRRGAVFFDRDGVLNVDHGHVGQLSRLEWIPGAIEAVRRVNDLGYYAFVVTNQAGVAKGYYTEADVEILHRHMADTLARAGAFIDEFSYCPFHPEAIIPQYAQVSEHRKPAPGMIRDIMAKWPIDPARAILFGDRDSDLEAAKSAGISGFKFSSGRLDDFIAPLLRT